ncbi:exocyst complex component 6 [Angomonas deanei]|uniref:Exocyst complex component SEC15 n=1 Tax=Angomonas deanei TaxID=59799 RepID=A0A7G2CUW5_9TRYP|nr:exocyst complex component 6 [Angomonas deanei]CAD2222861.1 hypothetical protein, conserved [Angomonas deanei]|eukprot:EPY38543.1 exocyst complex component 6 [Angomonas deanei]
MLEANSIERKLSFLIQSAQRTAAELALVERGAATGSFIDRGDQENDEASGSSDDNEDDDNNKGAKSRRAAARVNDTPATVNMAPSRYIAITSLVDGEFADYTTLKTAYMRHEEEDLLTDLESFIKENEGQVETLCKHHYPAFIHASQQCLSISEKDAQLVGEELSGATALVREAVLNMKQVAANLIVSRNTRNNLVEVRSLLARCMAVAEYIETAESQVQRGQLIGAISSIRELVRLSAALAEYAVGEYVLHIRVPRLSQSVFDMAVQQLNAWLRLLRDSAKEMGKAAVTWSGAISAGTLTKKVVMSEDGNYWWIVERFKNANIELAPFSKADVVTKVCNGAGIQSIFSELRCDEYFSKYYLEGRAQQSKADIFSPQYSLEGAGSDVVTEFENFCDTALGFMLLEDLVYSATSPRIQSTSEILGTWDRIAQVTSDRAMATSRALQSDPVYTEVMVRLLTSMRTLAYHAAENVKCVQLSAASLSRVAETLSDNLVSLWLQDACVTCTQLVLADSMTPLIAATPAEFEAYVTRFYFDKCSLLELPIPSQYTSGSVSLPYSAIVPTIGDKAMQLLAQCYSVMSFDGGSVVRQAEVNNVEEMLLKYLTVLFRTVSESLQGQLYSIDSKSIIQFAVFISSCSAMPVLVSCVEQQFMRRWPGSYGGEKQLLGSPKQLADSAAQFSRGVQKGIEALMQACVAELEERLKSSSTFSFWKRQLDYRSGKRKNESSDSFDDCMNFFLNLIPMLTTILQTSVLRSVMSTTFAHIGQKMQSSIELAIKAAYKDDERDFELMRNALHEFESQCLTNIPLWQRRLINVLPNISAALRFPIQVQSVMDDMTVWINQKEKQYAADRAAQPQILNGLEDATKVMTKGFQAMGKTTASVFGAKRD